MKIDFAISVGCAEVEHAFAAVGDNIGDHASYIHRKRSVLNEKVVDFRRFTSL